MWWLRENLPDVGVFTMLVSMSVALLVAAGAVVVLVLRNGCR